jgi:hypothetical protein
VELGAIKRLSIQRLFVPFFVLKKVLALRPSLLIICTHELLLMSALAKALTGCKVIYDVQENYYRNIRYGDSFPAYLRPFIAMYVRVKERLSLLFVDHYFLAERGYEHEMTFFGKKKTVIENKVVGPVDASKMQKDAGPIRLLFSGTLAETTGIFIAIDIAKKLHEQDHSIRLDIIGYSSRADILDRIRREIDGYSFIGIKGGASIVPHREIVAEIQRSHFGIISYPSNPSTENSTPTKLFEYLAYQLPILLIDNPRWLSVCAQYDAAISFNAGSFSAPEMLKAMKQKKFYSTLPQDVFWSTEEKRLLQTIETL